MDKNRLVDDIATVKAMIDIYCKGKHGREDLCQECLELANYAEERVNKCKFGAKKPVCGKCTVHCYKPEMREKIKKVMRYSGPKMLYKHPLMLINYIRHKTIY